jgi:hypothetical protein
MKIPLPSFPQSLLCVIACLLSFFIMPATASASTNSLFEQGNEALAQGDVQTAIEAYLKIADTEGTSPALAENIVAAAKAANEPGIVEWAERTILLRNTEWAIIIATGLSLIWAAAIAAGVWKHWQFKRHALTSLVCATGIAVSLWTVYYWMPPTHEAVIIRATPPKAVEPAPQASATTANSSTPSTTANILLSPFSTAEVVGALPLGAHVLLTPIPPSTTQPPEHYVYITHPDTQLTGWVHTDELRQTGN